MTYMNAIGLTPDTAAVIIDNYERYTPAVQLLAIVLLTVFSWAMLIGSVYLAGPLGLTPWFAAAVIMTYEIIVAKHVHG